MNKLLIMILIILTCSTVGAGYPDKIRYWYSQNISSNVPKIKYICELRDYSDGDGVKLEWKIQNPPSKAVIDAINNNLVKDWLESEKQGKKTVKVKNREKKFKALITGLGYTLPIQKGQLDNILTDLNNRVTTLLNNNNIKGAIDLQSKTISLIALWIKLGNNIYDKKIGE